VHAQSRTWTATHFDGARRCKDSAGVPSTVHPEGATTTLTFTEFFEQYRPLRVHVPLCVSLRESGAWCRVCALTYSRDGLRRQKGRRNALASFTENGSVRESLSTSRCVEMQDDEVGSGGLALHINNGVRIIVENDERQHMD
jgi:hypothetical protein